MLGHPYKQVITQSSGVPRRFYETWKCGCSVDYVDYMGDYMDLGGPGKQEVDLHMKSCALHRQGFDGTFDGGVHTRDTWVRSQDRASEAVTGEGVFPSFRVA
jgi:hypothetical protein